MVWTFGMMALRKADIGDFFSEFIRFTVTTGFFWWLLANGPKMAMAIINSLRQIGATAGGLPNTLTPSTPISIGFDIVKKAFVGLSWVHPIDNLAIVLISIAVVICMAVVAANILITLVTAWVMAYAGTFILGFGGSRWTSDMAIGYFKTMLGIGLELMTMTLLVGIATSVIDRFYNQLDGASIYELLLVFCVCTVLALLIHKIPSRIAALAGGGVGAGIGAGSVMATAVMAASTVSTGSAAAIAAGASGMAGGTQALMAAFSKANASNGGDNSFGMSNLMAATDGIGSNDSSGSALAAAMDGFGSESFGNSSSYAGSVSSQVKSSGSFGTAATKVGKVASDTVANLAQGSWDVATSKISSMKDSAMASISETTGGKIAAAIKARGNPKPAFMENSLSDGNGDAKIDEVAAFANRGNK